MPVCLLPCVLSWTPSCPCNRATPRGRGRGCSDAGGTQVSKETHRGTTARFKRWEWGKQIKESQPAYAWGRFITPLYGIKVVGFLAGVTYSVRASATIQSCF